LVVPVPVSVVLEGSVVETMQLIGNGDVVRGYNEPTPLGYTLIVIVYYPAIFRVYLIWYSPLDTGVTVTVDKVPVVTDLTITSNTSS